MCGRLAITLPPEAMRQLFAYEERPNFPPRYNIAPTQPVPIVRAARHEDGHVRRHFHLVRWGFIPGFVKDPKIFPLLFNARAEGLGEKASFRNALRRRRCLVPADAFYEWQRFGSGKGGYVQPHLCSRTDCTPMALAGLWETWMGPNGEEVDTACIVTTGANGVSIAIHSRLPAVIEPRDFDLWLDPDERSTDDAVGLLRPAENEILRFVPIGDAVNKVVNDGPEIQVPVGAVVMPPAPKAKPDERQADLF
jgi:putative SOS response-associated peptidase YedK